MTTEFLADEREVPGRVDKVVQIAEAYVQGRCDRPAPAVARHTTNASTAETTTSKRTGADPSGRAEVVVTLLNGIGCARASRSARWCGCRTRCRSRRRAVAGDGQGRGAGADLARDGGGGRRAARPGGEGQGRDEGPCSRRRRTWRSTRDAGPRDHRRRRAEPVGGAGRVRGGEHLPRHAGRGGRLHRRSGRRHRGRPGPDRRGRARCADARHPGPGHPFILVARDLAPADTATVDPEKVLGFVTTEGGPTSHTAILARTLGVPAVVAAAGALSVAEGTTVVLDGGAGTIDIAPERRRGPGRREADGGPARREAGLAGRGRHVGRPPDPAARQRRRPEERAGRGGRAARRASACSAPSSCSSTPRRSRRSPSRRRPTPASSRPFPTARRSWCARSTRARTSRWPSSTRARSRTRRSACGASGWRSRTRGSWTASCRPSPAPRSAARRTSG